MTTPELIARIKQSIQDGDLSKSDIETQILPLFDSNENQSDSVLTSRFGRIISYLGASILLLGIVFFISLFWDEMSDIIQILVTLGLGLGIFVSANLLLQKDQWTLPALSLHILPPFLIPFGITLTLQSIFPDTAPLAQVLGTQTIIFAVMSVLYGFSDYLFRKEFLTLITWAFGSITYGIFVAFLINAFEVSETFLYEWRGIVVFLFAYSFPLAGISYLLETDRKIHRLPILTYLVSTGVTLGALFTLSYDRPVLEALYVLPLMVEVYIGVVMKKLEILVISFFAIFLFITYINVRYFADAISWPLSLILIGATLIGLGYGFSKTKNLIQP